MKRYTLSRQDTNKLQRDSAGLAEGIAAGEYSAFSGQRDAGEFDLATKSGAVAEVKSTAPVWGTGTREDSVCSRTNTRDC